jgi:3-oxoadipate enol-lactonase
MLEIHERSSGGEHAVLLLHGCPSTTRCFEPLVSALSARWRVLVPELPGYGKTPALPGPYSLHRVQALLEDHLLGLGVHELSVVGFSAGAYRALALAFSSRVRVRHVASIAGFAGLDDPLRAAYRRLAPAVGDGTHDLRPGWLARIAGPDFAKRHPDDVEDVMAWLGCASRSVLAAELAAFAECDDLRPRLSELEIPVLARVGELDATALPDWSRDIAARAKHGKVEVVPGCGHALLYEDRDATVAAIVALLGT